MNCISFYQHETDDYTVKNCLILFSTTVWHIVYLRKTGNLALNIQIDIDKSNLEIKSWGLGWIISQLPSGS